MFPTENQHQNNRNYWCGELGKNKYNAAWNNADMNRQKEI
jgi:hypothetical protein